MLVAASNFSREITPFRPPNPAGKCSRQIQRAHPTLTRISVTIHTGRSPPLQANGSGYTRGRTHPLHLSPFRRGGAALSMEEANILNGCPYVFVYGFGLLRGSGGVGSWGQSLRLVWAHSNRGAAPMRPYDVRYEIASLTQRWWNYPRPTYARPDSGECFALDPTAAAGRSR